MMAMYLARGIEEGRLDYKLIFSKRVFQPLKSDVDAMLIADGFQAKIVEIL